MRKLTKAMYRTKRIVNALAVLVTLFLTGCFPYRVVERPGAVGRVIDHQTQQPIAGALIERKTATRTHKKAYSSPDGQFRLRPVIELHWQPLFPAVFFGGDVFPQDTLAISAVGYLPQEVLVEGYWLERKPIELRDVFLDNVSEQNPAKNPY